jgi:hypothetical protein
MDFRLKCEKPEDIVFTVTITMKAKEWEQLREQLTSKWPSSDLAMNISDLLAQARKIYWPVAPRTND